MSSGFLSDISLVPNALTRAVNDRLRAGKELIDLTDSNFSANGLLFPPEILEREFARYSRSRRYTPDPRGSLRAREAIVKLYTERTPSFKVSPEQIFLTASTSESYRLLFSLLAEPGENILAPDIAYPLFEHLAADARLSLSLYALALRSQWEINEESIIRAHNKASRGVLLVSPHNPTGHVVQQRLKALDELQLPVICDEVFSSFPYGIKSVPPLAALHPELPVFMLNGISKMLALPDLKLGWIVLNDRAYERYGAQLEILNDTYLSGSPVSQEILPELFKGGRDFIAQLQIHIRENLNFIISALSENSAFRCIHPDGGAFMFPQIISGADAEQLALSLIEKGVLVHPGFFYTNDSDDSRTTHSHLLISAIPEKPRLKRGLEIILSVL